EPTNPDDVEVHPPPPPKEHLAESIHGAVLLIEAGKRELALASLRAIWPHEKASAYVPFLLGNLYFDKHWWSVALVHYRIAIQKNHEYRRNPTLVRNVIRMLSNPKTSWKASAFLKKNVGKAAVPWLKYAAKHDPNASVQKKAAALAKTIR